jgi:hypothetical protein
MGAGCSGAGEMVSKVVDDLCSEMVRRNCEDTVDDRQNDWCCSTPKMPVPLYRLHEAVTREEDSFCRLLLIKSSKSLLYRLLAAFCKF